MIVKSPAAGPGQQRVVKPLISQIIPRKQDVFQLVKSIPFPEVLQVFYGQGPGRGGKIICPFHNENTPSFHVYEDGYYCFGCGDHGDNINFVAKIENLQPLDAAYLIAQQFRFPINKPLTKGEQLGLRKIKQRKSVSKSYELLEELAFLAMADFRSDVLELLEHIELDELEKETEKAVHMLPIIEDYMSTLATGSPEERLCLLREGVLTKWARLIK